MVDHETHIAWCKRRALACLERGEVGNAMAGLYADLLRHPTTKHLADRIEYMSLPDARAFVEGLHG